ncbi:MAG: tetratricopeptide repeat protein, partial [Cyanobacteria bacterium J06558_2]
MRLLIKHNFVIFACLFTASMTVNIDFSSLKPSAIPAAQASSIQSQIDSWLSNADSAYLSGDYQTAISLWVKITEHRHSETDQIATVHSKLASLYWHLGKTTKALKHWKSSLKIYRKINNDDSPEKIAAVLVDTARTYNDLNRPRFSIPLLTEAISLSRGNKALAKITSMAYLALGNAYMLEADYDLAIDAYQSSIENIPPTESELLIVIWSNLSKVYQQKSLITRQRAIAEAENEDTLANELWQRVADYQNKAWQAVNKAVQSGENSQSIAQVEALLQKVSLAKDGVTKSYDAENNLLQAQRILAALPDSPQKVYALLELNELIGNNTSKSELILNSAIATAQAINLPHVISFAFGAMGKHYESQKQYEDALFWTKRAQSQAQQVQALDILYQWDWQAARIYSATNNGAQATRYYERAITSLQSIRVNSTQTPGAPSFGFQQDIEPIARGFIKLLLSDDFSSYNLQQVLEIKDLLLLNELEDFFKDDCFEIITVNKADQLAYLNKTKTAVVHTII